MAEIKSVSVFSLFLILIVSSSSFSFSEAETDFNIYQAVLQWGPATCSNTNLTQRCLLLPFNRFTIQGLWPTRTSPFEIIGPCSGSNLDIENIRPLETSLRRNWPNVITGRQEFALWSEEWRRHGTCSEDYLDQFNYFSFILNSFVQHDIESILRNNGITANETTYRRDDVQAAINRAIGVRPAVRCNRNRLSQTQQLHEIVLCYDKDDESIRSCPSSSRFNTCPSRFDWFPYMRTYYGYFQIVLQWQPATCINTAQTQPCSRAPGNRFSMRGVWPTSRSNRILGPCEGSNFDANQIFSIRPRLERDWPDVVGRRDQEVWRSAWTDHGRCSEDQFGLLEYFNLAMFAFDRNDILGILRRNNITPNGRTLYRREDIENVIHRATRSRPNLVCNTRRQGQNNRRQLHEVIICYDDYGRNPRDCPPAAFTRCPETFYWFSA